MVYRWHGLKGQLNNFCKFSQCLSSPRGLEISHCNATFFFKSNWLPFKCSRPREFFTLVHRNVVTLSRRMRSCVGDVLIEFIF
jgi:hypothetical protein